jgi:ribokinase
MKIVVVGSYGTGLSMVLASAPGAGETVFGTNFASGHGGKGSNQAVAAARLGATVELCAVVGTDVYGSAAFSLWQDEGVQTGMVQVLDGSTMIGFILVEKCGENRIVIAPGVLDDFDTSHLAGLPEALSDADVLLVGLEIPLAVAHEALRIGRRAGVVTILNPAPAPARPILAETLALVDHLTPNQTEAARLAGLSPDTDPREILIALPAPASSTVVVTLGGAGALVSTGGTVVQIDAVAVDQVVDTTGAGDAFNAAYAVALARRLGPIEACGAQ